MAKFVRIFKNVLNYFLYKFGFFIKRTVDVSEIVRLADIVRRNSYKCELIRVGASGDGGYLIPSSLQRLDFCFSPGVDYNCSFENDLHNLFGTKCFLADASVQKPPIEADYIEFIKKFISVHNSNTTVRLSDWFNASMPDEGVHKCLLQMDIEGAEYQVLLFEDAQFLNNFDCIVVEFHEFHRIFHPDFFGKIEVIFEKIFKNFRVCHLHLNNVCDLVKFGDIEVPTVFEMTLVRKDYCEDDAKGVPLIVPHPLDQPNVSDRPNLVMPRMWWA